MKTRLETLQALLTMAEQAKPEGVTHESLEASDLLAEARQVIEQEEARQQALDDLVEYSRRVATDICEQDTGWFYQWSSKIDKAERFTTPNA